MNNAEPRRRRTHSQLLKSEVVAACAEPGASVVAIALARGLNTNLVHKWRRQATRTSGHTVTLRRDETAAVRSSGGYADFLAAIRDPVHEEHDAMLEWCGGTFDSTAFDLEAINETLRRFKL
jgi:hypothetical protein